MDLLYWSRHFRNMPGEGDLPVVDFMRAVAATGYDGPLSLEIFNDQFRGGSPQIDRGRRPPLAGLSDGPGARAPSRHIAIDVPAMPDRIAVSGVEFVEFAANDERGRGAGGAARHHGLLARGAPQAQGRAASIGRAASTSSSTPRTRASPIPPTWCTARRPMRFGLKVDDAAATVARARALGAETFEQRHGAGRAGDPGDPRRRRRRDLLHRRQSELARRLGDRVRAGRRRARPCGRRPDRRSTMSARRWTTRRC